ncbi:hypothetical protein F511_18940 [Dorcoceras hygrometricum]|uniref:Uncharacterized protein n=1 Tax=Dorcoceras hygrometricum TaxID=472368 RepID=A0A2Z7A9T1_9LAMI|nr:hypothetical protein F511_18940 [Dorcoceras hygrometricum]
MLLSVAPLLKTSRPNSDNRKKKLRSRSQIRSHLQSPQSAQTPTLFQLRYKDPTQLSGQQIMLPDRSLLQISSRATISFRFLAQFALSDQLRAFRSAHKVILTNNSLQVASRPAYRQTVQHSIIQTSTDSQFSSEPKLFFTNSQSHAQISLLSSDPCLTTKPEIQLQPKLKSNISYDSSRLLYSAYAGYLSTRGSTLLLTANSSHDGHSAHNGQYSLRGSTQLRMVNSDRRRSTQLRMVNLDRRGLTQLMVINFSLSCALQLTVLTEAYSVHYKLRCPLQLMVPTTSYDAHYCLWCPLQLTVPTTADGAHYYSRWSLQLAVGKNSLRLNTWEKSLRLNQGKTVYNSNLWNTTYDLSKDQNMDGMKLEHIRTLPLIPRQPKDLGPCSKLKRLPRSNHQSFPKTRILGTLIMLPCWRLGAWLRPVSRGNQHFTVGGGRLSQSGPRPEGRLLRQPALEGLTRSARMETPRKVGRNKFRQGAATWRRRKAAFWERRRRV